MANSQAAKADRRIGEGVIALAFLFMLAAILYSLAILAFQVLGWLKFGVWQAVPFGAMFLAPSAQRALMVTYDGPNAFSLVPSLAEFENIEDAASDFAGSFLGLAKILNWIFQSSLGGVLYIAGILAFSATAAYVSRQRKR